LSFARGRKLTGRIFLGDKPASRIPVAVFPANLTAKRPFTIPLGIRASSPVRSVLCDDRGGFVTPELAPGHYGIEVLAPGGRALQSDTVEVPAFDPTTPGGSADVVMEPLNIPIGWNSLVSVHTASGRAVYPGTVGIVQGGKPEAATFFSAATDPTGVARFEGLEQGVLTKVTCCTESPFKEQRTFDVVPESVALTVPDMAVIHGRVFDPDGRPVAGAVVSSSKGLERADSAAEGTFRLRAAPGLQTLTFAAEGFALKEVVVQVEDGTDHDLSEVEMALATVTKGVVLDKADRRPISAAQIAFPQWPSLGNVVSDEAGRFQVGLSALEPIAISVSAAGYATLRESIRESSDSVVLEMSRAGFLRIQVSSGDADEPCFNCHLVVRGEGEMKSLATDAAGTADSGPLAPGRYEVLLEEVQSRGSQVYVRGGDNVKSAAVRPRATTDVVFRQGDRTMALSFLPALPLDVTVVARSASRNEVAVRENSNRFLVRKPRGEAVSIWLVEPNGTETRSAIIDSASSREALEIPAPSSGVEGYVSRGGAAVADALLTLRGQDHTVLARTRTNPEGTFRIGRVVPSTYELVIGASLVQVISLREGEYLDLGTLILREK